MQKLFYSFFLLLLFLGIPKILNAQDTVMQSNQQEPLDDELDIVFIDEIVMTSEESKSIDFSGFLDTRYGTRIETTELFDKQATIAETRLQGDIKFSVSDYKFNIKADLLHDAIINESEIDLREAYVELPANEYMQVRIGRQNILWGIGDLIVSNDLFPKDYNGLFSGRDAEAEYMVKPSDAIRASFFINDSALDIIYSKFVPSDVPDGERLSIYHPLLGKTIGEDQSLHIKDDHENAWMLRWNKQIFNQEIALYYNRSYWQTPEGIDVQAGQMYYPKLNSFGLSSRGELGIGIYSAEISYFDSTEDKNGDKFWVRNSEYRYILSYEFELATDLSMSMQWYHETHLQHDNYLTSLPENIIATDEKYDLLTLRLNQMLLSQKMTLSLYTFYSPTQNDSYVRLNLFHKFDDQWMINIGSNHFNGQQTGRFGQLKENSNYFASIRYSF
jgi:hypothetical protein